MSGVLFVQIVDRFKWNKCINTVKEWRHERQQIWLS